MPTFKSIIDLVLLSYVHIMYEIDIPFVNGVKEFDNIFILSKIFRKCGAYFINPKNLKSNLYQIVIEELLG